MRILGIDPGLATIGFGILEPKSLAYHILDFGIISTSKKTPMDSRLNEIALDLEALCKKWQPNVCAIEKLYFTKNVSTGISVAQARGVILQTLNRLGYSISEYNPEQIKIALTGDGRATKEQVQKMVALILKLKQIPKPDDAADALAIAMCHAQTARYGTKTRHRESSTPLQK